MTSKKRNHQMSNSRIWSAAKRLESLLKPLFSGVSFLIYYFKKHFKPCFFILKALKDILQPFKFVNWWIDCFGFLMSRTGYKFKKRVPINLSTSIKIWNLVTGYMINQNIILLWCWARLHTLLVCTWSNVWNHPSCIMPNIDNDNSFFMKK